MLCPELIIWCRYLLSCCWFTTVTRRVADRVPEVPNDDKVRRIVTLRVYDRPRQRPSMALMSSKTSSALFVSVPFFLNCFIPSSPRFWLFVTFHSSTNRLYYLGHYRAATKEIYKSSLISLFGGDDAPLFSDILNLVIYNFHLIETHTLVLVPVYQQLFSLLSLDFRACLYHLRSQIACTWILDYRDTLGHSLPVFWQNF